MENSFLHEAMKKNIGANIDDDKNVILDHHLSFVFAFIEAVLNLGEGDQYQIFISFKNNYLDVLGKSYSYQKFYNEVRALNNALASGCKYFEVSNSFYYLLIIVSVEYGDDLIKTIKNKFFLNDFTQDINYQKALMELKQIRDELRQIEDELRQIEGGK